LIKSQKIRNAVFSYIEEEKTILIHEISGKAVKRVFGSGAGKKLSSPFIRIFPSSELESGNIT